MLVPLANTEARDLLEIIEARHKKGSTIFSSQFTPAVWHNKIGEGTLADAILDRIVHDSYTILIDGEESMRKLKEPFALQTFFTSSAKDTALYFTWACLNKPTCSYVY